MSLQLSDSDLLSLIHNGLADTSAPRKRVLILGAGMAGLSAADVLLRAGHEVEILEAQNRLGGRILTLREPFAPGLYGEAGAMRIPKVHQLTLAYIERFNLPTFPFTLSNPRGYSYMNGVKMRLDEVEADPDRLEFDVAPSERGKLAGHLWDEVIEGFARQVEQDGQAAWDEIVRINDEYSVREYLEKIGWSEGLIEMFGLFNNQESMMNSSFLELLREDVGRFYSDLVQVEGGMDRLPYAFLPQVKDCLRLGARVTALDQSPEQVIVHYQTYAGRFEARADYAIVTLPFPVLRHIEVFKPFSRPKQRAIRQLNYDASAKIFLQSRRRFWEVDDGIVGGGSVTDLAVRNIFYPEHGRETGRGVLLASYTWGEDAQRWGSLSPEDRIYQSVENIAEIHPQILDEIEGGASKMWHDDPYAGGAFALFDPGQQTLLHDHILTPEGRYYFAGEHASLAHAWIQGAIESGLLAAHTIHSL
jgi:monoamine oxidase